MINSLEKIQWVDLSPEDKRFLTMYLCELLQTMTELKLREPRQLAIFFEKTSSASWPWKEIILEANLSRLMTLAHQLTKNQSYAEASALAGIVITAHPESTEAKILAQLERTRDEELRASG